MDVTIMGYDENKHEHPNTRGIVSQIPMGTKAYNASHWHPVAGEINNITLIFNRKISALFYLSGTKPIVILLPGQRVK
jgi:hypothetical protein